VWIVIASGISAVVAIATLRRWRAGYPDNLGYVTERWLMEYRADHGGDSR
jgi:hypothetical protein